MLKIVKNLSEEADNTHYKMAKANRISESHWVKPFLGRFSGVVSVATSLLQSMFLLRFKEFLAQYAATYNEEWCCRKWNKMLPCSESEVFPIRVSASYPKYSKPYFSFGVAFGVLVSIACRTWNFQSSALWITFRLEQRHLKIQLRNKIKLRS